MHRVYPSLNLPYESPFGRHPATYVFDGAGADIDNDGSAAKASFSTVTCRRK
jgi:hypothetical protein